MNVRLATGLVRTGGIALVLVSVAAAVHPHMGLLGFRRPLVVPAMVVAVFVALALRLRLPDGWRRPWVLPAVVVGSATVCTTVAQLMRYTYGWDANALMQMARVVDAGDPLPPYAYDYLSLYPNTIPMIAMDRVSIGIGHRLGLAPEAIAAMGNGIALAVTLGVVGFLVRRVVGVGMALAAQLLVVVLVGFSPWMSVPYTDLPAMPFVVGAVALGVLAVERRSSWARVLLWAASALAVAVAYVIKTTPAVVLVALVLLVLVVTLQPGGTAALRRRRLARGVVGAVAALATFAVGVLGLTATSTAVSGINTAHVRADVTPPIGWWLANGMNFQTNPSGGATYGTYSSAMVNAIRGKTPDEMAAYARGYIAQRWDQRGLHGTVSFYASKAVWNWGDGMFWAWGEGGDAVRGAPVHTGPVAEALWSVNNPHGDLYRIRADLTQALWLAVLLLAGLGALVVRPRRDVLLMVVVLLGAAGFTLLFQGRSRYIFVFAPVAVTMAAVSLPAVRARITWPTRVAPRTRRPEGRASVEA